MIRMDAGVIGKQGYNTRLMAVKNLLYALSYAPENSERIYYFLLIDAEKEEEFQQVLKGCEPFNLKEYATVIASGYGDAPEGLKDELLEKYNAIL